MGKALARTTSGAECSAAEGAYAAAESAAAMAHMTVAGLPLTVSSSMVQQALPNAFPEVDAVGDAGNPTVNEGTLSTASAAAATPPAVDSRLVRVEETEEVETNVLKVLRAQVEQLARELVPAQDDSAPALSAGSKVAASRAAAGAGPALAEATPATAAAASRPAAPRSTAAAPSSSSSTTTAAAAAPTSTAAAPLAVKSPLPPKSVAGAAAAAAAAGTRAAAAAAAAANTAAIDEEDERPITLAGFGGGAAARGVGRGRPMGAQAEGPLHATHGRGMGRGRALAPPPGLQGLSLHRNQHNVPGGLSRSWMPGPPIPEAEVEDSGTVENSPVWPTWPADVDHNGMPGGWLPELELPSNALLGSEFAWSKHSAMSPSLDWGRTPSTLASPPEMASPALRTSNPYAAASIGAAVTGSGMDAASAAAAAAAAMQAPMVIPMYVTVPLAMAHSCPHCHKHFALHSETGLPIETSEDTTG